MAETFLRVQIDIEVPDPFQGLNDPRVKRALKAAVDVFDFEAWIVDEHGEEIERC